MDTQSNTPAFILNSSGQVEKLPDEFKGRDRLEWPMSGAGSDTSRQYEKQNVKIGDGQTIPVFVEAGTNANDLDSTQIAKVRTAAKNYNNSNSNSGRDTGHSAR